MLRGERRLAQWRWPGAQSGSAMRLSSRTLLVCVAVLVLVQHGAAMTEDDVSTKNMDSRPAT